MSTTQKKKRSAFNCHGFRNKLTFKKKSIIEINLNSTCFLLEILESNNFATMLLAILVITLNSCCKCQIQILDYRCNMISLTLCSNNKISSQMCVCIYEHKIIKVLS